MAESRRIQLVWRCASVLFVVFTVALAQIKTESRTPVRTVDKCEVHDMVPCGRADITKAACESIGCCFDGQRCYYGRSVTVQCTRDGQFVIVVAKDSTRPWLDVGSVTLLGGRDAPCSPVATTDLFAVYHFPVSACGSVVKVESDYIIYENKMSSSYEVGIAPLGSITRDSLFELIFQCRYWGAEVVSLVAEVNTVPPPLPVAVPGPLRVELRLANGHCATKGCNEEAAAYTSYYQASDYPVTKVLRRPVYVEVRILERTDPNLVLLLEHCWATSTPDPLSLPQWSLLVNGCPYHGDKYLTTLVPVDSSSGLPFPTHYKRFVVRMFTFVHPTTHQHLHEKVFIHCTTAVCHPSPTDSCEQRCFRKSRDVAAVLKNSSNDKIVVSSGEMLLVDPTLDVFKYITDGQ